MKTVENAKDISRRETNTNFYLDISWRLKAFRRRGTDSRLTLAYLYRLTLLAHKNTIQFPFATNRGKSCLHVRIHKIKIKILQMVKPHGLILSYIYSLYASVAANRE